MTPSRWWMVKVRGAPGPQAELLPSLLLEWGARAVLEEGEGEFVATFEPPEDPEAEVRRLVPNLEEQCGLQGLDVEWWWQPHADWESLWRRGLEIRRITGRITIRPSWLEIEPRPGELVVTLDPGMAFGTAEHPTTRGCLRLLDGAVGEGEVLADVGAGSAILSVAAALLGAASVHAVESDPWAVEAAGENVERNGVAHRVRVEERFVDVPWLEAAGPWDGLVANIERGVVVPLLPGFRTAIRPGGWLILSGIQEMEAEAVRDAALTHGFTPVQEDREEGWWSALFRLPPH